MKAVGLIRPVPFAHNDLPDHADAVRCRCGRGVPTRSTSGSARSASLGTTTSGCEEISAMAGTAIVATEGVTAVSC